MWCFGLGRAALLVANTDLASRRFHLFEHVSDMDHFFDDIEGLAVVLDRFERADRGLTHFQKAAIADDIGPLKMLEGLHLELAKQDDAWGMREI